MKNAVSIIFNWTVMYAYIYPSKYSLKNLFKNSYRFILKSDIFRMNQNKFFG